MAKNNNETKAPEATAKPAASDAPPMELELLRTQLEDTKKMLDVERKGIEAADKVIKGLQKSLKETETRAADAEKRLKLAKSAPTGDVVVLGGKTWAVKGTVQAKFALDEVKKGFILEDATLVILGNEAE